MLNYYAVRKVSALSERVIKKVKGQMHRSKPNSRNGCSLNSSLEKNVYRRSKRRKIGDHV